MTERLSSGSKFFQKSLGWTSEFVLQTAWLTGHSREMESYHVAVWSFQALGCSPKSCTAERDIWWRQISFTVDLLRPKPRVSFNEKSLRWGFAHCCLSWTWFLSITIQMAATVLIEELPTPSAGPARGAFTVWNWRLKQAGAIWDPLCLSFWDAADVKGIPVPCCRPEFNNSQRVIQLLN